MNQEKARRSKQTTNSDLEPYANESNETQPYQSFQTELMRSPLVVHNISDCSSPMVEEEQPTFNQIDYHQPSEHE